MVYTCQGFKKFEKSGKCRIRIKIRIRNSEKNFFWIFLFFNCEQFLLNKFSSKMVINPKKYVFCIFHICQLLPVNQIAYIIYVVKVGKKLASSLTVHNPAQFLFPGKNRIRKIREKSGYQIFTILGQILRTDTINHWFME